MNFSQIYVLIVVVLLVFALYKEIVNPGIVFFLSAVALVVGKIITPQELLSGLSNVQIIIIFLLVTVTAGIRKLVGSKFFSRLFSHELRPLQFLLRMIMFVSVISAFLNNTPIVAFMIPYVREWAQRTGNPVSKFLIPLSFATVLGGMITVIGTSTNLVLNGLIDDYKLPLLGFEDFFYLGVCVTILGWIYFYFVGYNLLPAYVAKFDTVKGNLKEYIVETEIFSGSKIIGKSVKEAGLRSLVDLFLVEIARGERVISPVSPEELLERGDLLYFSGNTDAIYNFIKEQNGLGVHQNPLESGRFNFLEAVVPANSTLVGVKIKNSNFRKKYDASIVAIQRDGMRLGSKVGETVLQGGDFLLLVAGEDHQMTIGSSNLFIVSVPKSIEAAKPKWFKYVGLVSFLILLSGVLNYIPLFFACLLVLCVFVFLKILGLEEIQQSLDLGLLTILVCSLAVGIALEKSGAAALLAGWLIQTGKYFGVVAALSSLFMFTLILTQLITNAAAVAIVFPVAMSMASQLNLPTTPFFVAIAFAASACFLSPIGYQTNLMVYGPGGYSFKDFFRVGLPLTVIYTATCILFITFFYNLN